MRRWMLIPITAAVFVLGFSAYGQPPRENPATPALQLLTPPSVTPIAATEEGVRVAPGTCATCGPQTKVGKTVASHFSKPRPEPYCFQCSTPACEWRFFLGGCHAYFGEGRFGPAIPEGHP